ncbi:hypothetical protein JD77_05438 [Micromonospora olivasterospora]|uniref:Uncharacterized protein n=1 Tax=Micromonospora olivasterospora TaxID=1880 RepID=A0A562II29_MICOL|nr:hypothetical protein JD77_05438 [Micromonospora olivasterospora]
MATTRPPLRYATASTRPSSNGDVASTTVVRPARAVASRRAMRSSVWASTADVGSIRISTSGSASRARASRTRCRCPPESVRARVPIGVPSPSGSASATSSAEAARRAARISGSPTPGRTRRISRSVPPKRYESWSATRIRARTSSSAIRVSGTPPQVTSPAVYRPSRSASATASAGSSLATPSSPPAGTVSPLAGSCRSAGPAGAGRSSGPPVSSGAMVSRAMIRRAATRPRISWYPPSSRNQTGTMRVATYP